MKRLTLTFFFILGLSVFTLPSLTTADGGISQLQQWKTGGTNVIQPTNSSVGLLVPGLATSTTGCLSVRSNGYIVASGSVCGSGSGTVTSVATNSTLTGGPISTTGTLGINLANPNVWSGGQIISASSTIGDGTQQGGLTISGGATTTLSHYIGGNLNIGSSTPSAGEILTIQGTGNGGKNALLYNGSALLLSESGQPGTGGNGDIVFTPSNGAVRWNFTGANASGIMRTTISSSVVRTWQIDNTGIGGLNTIFSNFLAGGDITGSGEYRVGINATSTPSALLSVAGTSGSSTPLFAISSTTPSFATSTVLLVDFNGKVGIGTSTAPVTLTVQGYVQAVSTATSTACSTAIEGSQFYNLSNHHLWLCMGSEPWSLLK